MKKYYFRHCTLATLDNLFGLRNNHPLYGAYVIGSDWNFMVLEEKYYTISRDYSALSAEVYDLLRILKALKQIMLALTA
jgi:hypothetical protein